MSYAVENGEVVPVVDPTYEEQLPSEVLEIIEERVASQVQEAVWEGVARFATEVLAHENPKLTVTSFCFAAGLFITEGKSQTQLANELGVTRSALSKRIVRITEALGLPPSRGMKSIKARQSYRVAHGGDRKTRESNYLLPLQRLVQHFARVSVDTLCAETRALIASQLAPLAHFHASLKA